MRCKLIKKIGKVFLQYLLFNRNKALKIIFMLKTTKEYIVINFYY